MDCQHYITEFPERKKGQHLQLEERGAIQALRGQGFSNRAIARLLGCSLLAYCLMENHVHLLVRDAEGRIPVFMKKLGVSYAQYYNRKYERSGHLFQDRYKSEIKKHQHPAN